MTIGVDDTVKIYPSKFRLSGKTGLFFISVAVTGDCFNRARLRDCQQCQLIAVLSTSTLLEPTTAQLKKKPSRHEEIRCLKTGVSIEQDDQVAFGLMLTMFFLRLCMFLTGVDGKLSYKRFGVFFNSIAKGAVEKFRF